MNSSSEKTASAGLSSPNKKREQIGWYFYDWANSAFATTVVTVFLGPYLTTITQAAADADDLVRPLGFAIKSGSFFPYLVSLSVLMQVLILPILGGIADDSERKKEMLAVFAYVGAISTMGFYFLEGENYLYGAMLFLVANLSFGAALVFYNAFLPQIANADERNYVSSRGWAMGYLGGGILLAINLLLFSKADFFGLDTAHAVRISLASAGLWWAIFSLVSLKRLRNQSRVPAHSGARLSFFSGFKRLRRTLSDIRQYPETCRFLVAYLLYNDGIQTVITLSSLFGQEALGIPISTLTGIILMVQFVAFFGAISFEKIAGKIGTKSAIILSLSIWTLLLIYAYAFLETTQQFVGLAVVIAIVLGGSQALSRSVFSQMIPLGQEAAYFSFYEISERGTSWLGPLLFGLALQWTGSYRVALLSLIVFFILGLFLFIKVDLQKAALAVGNQAS